jgi:hypothetical protein
MKSQRETKPIGRNEAKRILETMPIETVLSVKKNTLTKKQKEFAKAIALGETGAEAYRQAYDSKGKPHTVSNEATRLKANPLIAAQIEAIRLANEAATYATAESLRSLILHSLTQVLIDPETKAAQKIQAARVLGDVTEIGMFTQRVEHKNVSDSAEIKSQIMDQLKGLMLQAGSSDSIEDVEAIDLLAELSANDSGNDSETLDSISETVDGVINLATDEGYYGGTDPNLKLSHPPDTHTIQHKVPPKNIDPDFGHSSPAASTPMPFENEEGGGVYKNLEDDS